MRILAVDDEPAICKLVATTLASKGHEVVTAHDGAEALEEVQLQKPDLIVLDVMMPHMDGWEVRRRLAADEATSDIPIIFLTAVGQIDSQLAGLESGLVEYLTKPFAPSELAALVASVEDPERHGKQLRERDVKTAKLRTISQIVHRREIK
jgi:DNA-binding response OmpR family regulator